MDNFNKYRQKVIISVATIFLIIFVGFTNLGRNTLYFTERLVGDILSPVVKVIGVTANGVISGAQDIISIPKLYKENKTMKEELVTLRSENLKLNNIISRTDYLRDELKLINNSKYEMVKANVIGKSDGNWFNQILIDKGLNSGLKLGDTVVTAINSANGVVVEGLVGKIVEIGDNWSNVDCVINDGNSVAFKNIRTQDGGVLNGDSSGKLSGFTYDNYADIVVNDKLYTSGIGDLYKGDLYIGTIISVNSDEDEMVKKIISTPAIDFKKLYKVFVIKD